MTYAPYRNRWIVLSQGQVVGVGLRPDQAYRSARTSRSRDKYLRLLYVDQTGFGHLQPNHFKVWFDHPLIQRLAQIFKQQGQEAYLVGGTVRDGLLGSLNAATDLDILVPRQALDVARKLANTMQAAYYPIDAERDVGRVVWPDQNHIDIASYRGETLTEDLASRDFTINAIALSLDLDQVKILDPLGGQLDLQAGKIRPAGPNALSDDPLRTIRAVRFARSFNFVITAETKTLILPQVARLKTVSAERLRDEVHKILQGPKPSRALLNLNELNILPLILPEVTAMIGVEQSPPHHLPVFEHTLRVMDFWAELSSLKDERLAFLYALEPQLSRYFQEELAGHFSRAALMPWAALLHDVGKPKTAHQEAADKPNEGGKIRFWQHPQVGAIMTETLLNQWRFSTQAIRFVTTLVEHHLRPLLLAAQKSFSQRAVYRFLADTGDVGPAIAILSLMDHLGTYPLDSANTAAWADLTKCVHKICTTYFTPKPPLLLSGREVMQLLKLSPGPRVGQIMRALKEAQALGKVKDKEAAIRFVKKWRTHEEGRLGRTK